MKKNSIYSFFLAVFVVLTALMTVSVYPQQGRAPKLSYVERPTGSLVVSTTIVISQANGGGGGSTGTYLFDYVELKNISSSPQSLGGLSLYYGSAVGNFASTASNAFALPNVTLNPGQYYLVQTGPTGTAGAPLPVTPDAVTANLTMSAASGKVALATAGLAINTCGAMATPCSAAQLALLVDWVAYGAAGNGTAGNGEGGTATNNGVAITSTQGNVRNGVGCTDTDNNNADFTVVTAPVPRNTATTASPCGAVARRSPVDFNGDGKTDFVVARNNGGANGQIRWHVLLNGGAALNQVEWGLASDTLSPHDFDGDGKTDYAVWRPAPILAGQPTSGFYIFQSLTSTLRFVQLGLNSTLDDASVVADFDGDGKADPAIYRPGASNGQSTFWFIPSSGPNNGIQTPVQWGLGNDTPITGDFTGDGKADFCVQRNVGGQGVFYIHPGTGGNDVPGANTTTTFGLANDTVVQGDYDGDARTDIAVIRTTGGVMTWYVLASTQGFSQRQFGLSSDLPVPGDYDGDGRTDYAVWRGSTDATQNYFFFDPVTSAAGQVEWGQCPFGNCDVPVAFLNTH